MKRRDFLKHGLQIGVAANALPMMMGGFPIKALGRSPLRSALQTQGSTNNNVLVIIQLQGGNDGLNCVVPADDPQYAKLRPTLGLAHSAVAPQQLSDHTSLYLHPSLATNGGQSSKVTPSFFDLYNAKKVAILQNVGYENPILSHFRGTDVWQTATDSNIYSSTGWIGRWLQEQNGTVSPTPGSWPLAIQIGNSLGNTFFSEAGGMGIALNKLPSATNLSTFNYDALQASPVNPNAELGYVRTIQAESNIYANTLGSKLVKGNAITYPANNTLATQLSYVAKCIANTFAIKVYLVTIGSFDTHSDQLTRQASLLAELSAAVGAFQTDLEQLGVADNVTMLTYSEFGRRPQENGSGTDHGTAAPHFVIGTQVQNGVLGKDPDITSATLNAKTNPEYGNMIFDSNYEFRNVYATVLNEWLMDPSKDNTATIDAVLTGTNPLYSTTKSWNMTLPIFKTQSSGVAPEFAPGLMLLQNYPNPFVGTTEIQYAIPKTMQVQLSVYNLAGEEVARIFEGTQSAGNHLAQFNSGNLPSGTYLYQLKTGDTQITQRMVVVK